MTYEEEIAPELIKAVKSVRRHKALGVALIAAKNAANKRHMRRKRMDDVYRRRELQAQKLTRGSRRFAACMAGLRYEDARIN